MDDDSKSKVDYLAKYRPSTGTAVVNADFLTFVRAVPKQSDVRGGRLHTHCSMPYAALSRVEYFDGRWVTDWRDREAYTPRPGEQPERMTLYYLGGTLVELMGFHLEPLYRQILRREVDWVEERFIEATAERNAVREQEAGKPTVTSIDVFSDSE